MTDALQPPSLLQTLLDYPVVRRIRRNHGLEHATIHLLSRKVSNLAMVGRSDANGFWLYGDVDTELVEDSVYKALDRMRGGEARLAIHPNCGTNLVTTAFIGATAALLALVGAEKEKGGKWSRFPLVVMGIMVAVVLGQPLGARLQEHVTTDGDPADLVIKEIRRTESNGLIMHRVDTWST